MNQTASMLGRRKKPRAVLRSKSQGATNRSSLHNPTYTSFVAELSHELRTTLLNVSGYAELLLQPNSLGVSDQEILGAIHTNSRYVVDLLDSMLDAARSEAGQSPAPSACSPRQVAEDVLNSFSVQAKAKGIAIQFRPGKRLPRKIFIDEMRLRRILVNLVSNAVKYSSTGTVTITADADPRPGKREGAKPAILWKVQDQGPGIAGEDIADLCAPFNRGKAGESSSSCGSGLGLFITKQLVESLGGELEVMSSVGAGTTFVFGLPVTVLESEAPDEPENGKKRHKRFLIPNAGDGRTTQSTGRLLVVENDPDLRRLIDYSLSSSGLDVTTASNGDEALALPCQDYDVILLDLQMPKMNGHSTARQLRAMGFRNAIIAFSGEAPLSKAAMVTSGFTTFLHKTTSLQRLLATCLDHLPPPNQKAVGTRRLPSTHMPDFAELQRNYVQQLSVTFGELHEALALDDRELLQRASHSIMGTSGLYGLTTVGELAKKLHHAVLAGKPNETLEAIMRQLKRESQQIDRPSGSVNRPR